MQNTPHAALGFAFILVCSVGIGSAVVVGVLGSPTAASNASDGAGAALVDTSSRSERGARAADRQRSVRTSGRDAPRKDEARRSAQQRTNRGSTRRSSGWELPVRSYELTGRFGQSGSRWSSFHHGLDFATETGTPIHAIAPGRIITAGWGGAYGNYIMIEHPNGAVSLYGHMSEFERTSGWVHAGTVIGYVGATGNVTGPHVHLEIRPDGGGLDDAVDPESYLREHGLDP